MGDYFVLLTTFVYNFPYKSFYILGSLFLIHKRISLPGKSICKTSNSIPYTDFYKHHFNVIIYLLKTVAIEVVCFRNFLCAPYAYIIPFSLLSFLSLKMFSLVKVFCLNYITGALAFQQKT